MLAEWANKEALCLSCFLSCMKWLEYISYHSTNISWTLAVCQVEVASGPDGILREDYRLVEFRQGLQCKAEGERQQLETDGECWRPNTGLSCGMGSHSHEEKIQISSSAHLAATSNLFLIHSHSSTWSNPSQNTHSFSGGLMVMVNLMCPLDQDTGCPDIWPDIILVVSGRGFLNDIIIFKLVNWVKQSSLPIWDDLIQSLEQKGGSSFCLRAEPGHQSFPVFRHKLEYQLFLVLRPLAFGLELCPQLS